MNNFLENRIIIEIEEFEDSIEEEIHWLFKLYNFIKKKLMLYIIE